MNVVADVIDRLYLQYLQPPDSEPPLVPVTHSFTVDDAEVRLGKFAVAEDEALIRVGSLIEVGHELMRVEDWNPAERRVTVRRGVRGTVPVAHVNPPEAVLSPPFPRSVVFAAVADTIVGLGHRLYTVSGDIVVEFLDGAAPVEDPLAYQVEQLWIPGSGEVEARIVDVHPRIGGRAVVCYRSFGTGWVRYRRRLARPASEATRLGDVGLEPSWVTVVMVSAAADLLAGRDIPALHSEWVSRSLDVEAERPGSRSSVALQLARYREVLIDRYTQEMEIEYGIETEMLSPFRRSVRPGLG